MGNFNDLTAMADARRSQAATRAFHATAWKAVAPLCIEQQYGRRIVPGGAR
jgi:hypothetical protein